MDGLTESFLTDSPFSLTREKLEGESIFISSLADGSEIDIKGDAARRGAGGVGGRGGVTSRSEEKEGMH